MISFINGEFIKIPGTVNTVGIKTASGINEMPGVFPLVDENLSFLNIVAVGNKNGIDHSIDLSFLKKRFPKAKFIFNCQNGPYLVSYYNDVLKNLDGHMTLDYDPTNSKSLYLRWNNDLDYMVKVKSRTGQYNAPVTLFIRIGTLESGQEK